MQCWKLISRPRCHGYRLILSAVDRHVPMWSKVTTRCIVSWKLPPSMCVPEIVAGDIVRAVLGQQKSQSPVLILCNQGDLTLTEEFIRQGAHNVIVSKAIKKEIPALKKELKAKKRKKFLADNDSKVTLVASRLGTWPEMVYRGLMSEFELLDLIPRTTWREWDEEPAVTVLGYIPVLSNGRHAIYHMCSSLSQSPSGLYSAGRIHWFILMQPSMYKRLYKPTQYIKKQKTCYAADVVVCSLYDIKLCLTLRCSDFSPEIPAEKARYKSTTSIVCGEMEFPLDSVILVQLTARADVFDDLRHEDIRRFHCLMNELLKGRRTNRLITQMEQLMPGCGLRLITMGFTMPEELWQVSPERMLTIYKAIASWPEFKNSPLENIFAKITNPGSAAEEEQHTTQTVDVH